MDLKIKILNDDIKDFVPAYAKEGDAGIDLVSAEDITIPPGEFKKVRLGIAIEIPYGYFGKLEGRSGLASKHGIGVLGGVIDRTYRGEVCAILMNNGKYDFPIKKMDRVVQLVILPYGTCDIQMVDDLTATVRNDAGFGSTGV